ncbi:hypothetical protein FW778_04155 [Ginsengibacter hankyongi]|uniref:HTH luxR-type domain-containing protein n=1 Tax=Ginsengibacter hankyongi TaxID=2607284 RepID=A0A5J5IJS4_9BACT|nr:hypothetical protein FW778_04155 [Ginsengibacter hankyongi]
MPEKYPQLLWCMWQGHSARDMAEVTGLTENTVKFYLRDIYRRIGSRGKSALESFMKREGLL